MIEMIERMAKAMWDEACPGMECGIADRDFHMSMVRVGLKSAREPTDAMLEAGEANLFEHLPEAKEWTLTYMRDAYKAMIDEVLK